jgi:hypothetical protein
MDTTTPTEGAVSSAQPTQPTEAVKIEGNEQVISQDANGTPTLEPITSQNDQPSANTAVEDAPAPETQAESDDIQSWAEKKGLPLDDPVKLAQMYREAEKKMHDATVKAREFNAAVMDQPLIDYTGNEAVDQLAAQVNQLTIQNKVNSFWETNPDARQFESQMAEIVTQRPHLQNDLDALYALARNDPTREADLKREGGREALTNLAQKQQAVPPSAAATNSGSFEGGQITSQNVYDLIDQHDQAWFQKNYQAINKAISG